MADNRFSDEAGLYADQNAQELLVGQLVTFPIYQFAGPLNVVGYDWVEFFVNIVTGAVPPTKLIFQPFTDLTATEQPVPGLRRFAIPYEPAVSGTGTTTIYPYIFEIPVVLNDIKNQCFRVPAFGSLMTLAVGVDVNDATVSVRAFRQKVGGPKAR